jgi:hypothetical protein
MKNKIFLLIFIISSSNVIAQSKKKIIEILNTRIDSLNIEIINRDVKNEQEAISFRNNNQTLISQIKKYEDNLKSVKLDFDSIQKINIQLNENNLNLRKELGNLKDSIYILQSKRSSINDNETVNIEAALRKIKNKWAYFMEEFTDLKYIIKDSLNEICNDERCVSFLLTNGFLVATYRINEVVEFDTQIIDLTSNQDILSSSKIKINVYGFDKRKNVLLVSNEDYDNNGRFWRYGTWGFKDKTLKLGKKEY